MDTPSSHYSHPMPSGEPHYPQQQGQAHSQQQSQWPQPPHLLPPSHNQSSFPSPASPSTTLNTEQHFPPYFSQQSQSQPSQSAMNGDNIVDRSSTSLSLNLSSLTVTSPTNLSPIHPGSHISPITPISPSNATLHQNSLSPHHHHSHHHHAHMQQQPFQFSPPDQGVRYDDAQYDSYPSTRRLTSSRSSSSSEKSVPRKRSFTTGTPLPTSLEESAATPVSGSYDHTNGAMDTSPYDEVDMSYGGMDADGSPVDGSTSGGEQDDQLKPLDGGLSSSTVSITTPIIGKPLGPNNFVTKLYQMINDPKSASFISWTELGTSFVVSNVGEFSRTILGSHFKHNNFSSFVRQLNMYGFHKINRTPRAQRTSADVQTWEFSHHKFLRGRPDLLEEIKRKALEPDPTVKHRVELPGEVAAQLNQVRDENRKLSHALVAEKNRSDKLINFTKAMYESLAKALPGMLHIPFPADLLDGDSPNILVTSPTNAMTASHYPSLSSLSSLSNPSLHSLHSLSPSSSPTAAEFPSHTHTPHSLSRQQSFQHMPYDTGAPMHPAHHHQHHSMGHPGRYDNALSTPLPPSPGMDVFGEERGSNKRQRTSGSSTSVGDDIGVGVSVVSGVGVAKKGSRARSDSAPLGYGLGSGWTQTRPRSGSGLGPRGLGRREELPVPNIGSLSRGQTLPMLSIPTKQQGQA